MKERYCQSLDINLFDENKINKKWREIQIRLLSVLSKKDVRFTEKNNHSLTKDIGDVWTIYIYIYIYGCHMLTDDSKNGNISQFKHSK